MRITKQTLEELQAMGIEAKIYPYAHYDEWYKECWQKEFDWSLDYSRLFYDRADEQKEAEAKQKATKWANDRASRRAHNWYDADMLYIAYEGRLIRKKQNVKSKQITTEYVLKAVERDRKTYQGAYGKFAEQMQQLLSTSGFRNMGVIYPTTYGIGVWAFYNFNLDKCTAAVDKILNDRGIKFRNEWSDAEYVFRYVISKEKTNLEKINQ